MEVKVIAEIGINHNGDLSLAKKLIDVAAIAGCHAVKFQKRTIDRVYTAEYLASYRESPWGTTQREQKEGLEFGYDDYKIIDAYCKEKGLEWFASAWDLEAQEFLSQFNLKYNKIASAMLVNDELLEKVAKEGRYTFIATGMSNYEEIDHAVGIFRQYNCPFELMHCVSSYPASIEEINLKLIQKLKDRYSCNVGYSGHEKGTLVSAAAVALGASSIERHITLDKKMYGSDQSASIEPGELIQLVKSMEDVEIALGDGEKLLSAQEEATKKKLRG